MDVQAAVQEIWPANSDYGGLAQGFVRPCSTLSCLLSFATGRSTEPTALLPAPGFSFTVFDTILARRERRSDWHPTWLSFQNYPAILTVHEANPPNPQPSTRSLTDRMVRPDKARKAMATDAKPLLASDCPWVFRP